VRLTGKNILVTGGSRGLGKALVQRFAREGAKIALCARSEEALKATAADLRDMGVYVIAQTCDIGDSAQVERFVAAVLSEFDSIDVLVNNASAIAPLKHVWEYSIQEWDHIIRTNLNGLFYVTRGVLPSMITNKSGCIINVSSSVGRAARPRWGAYSASKYGVEGLTQVLSEELKPFNISVNSVNPGPLATDMRRVVHPEEDQKQLHKPELVTDIFVYLASNDGKGISGQLFDAATYIAKL
jgi:NAD(P)-dependent dehydrogenase (short-subunit alcohol dehydrogenase family)